jgi:hypothetical protein
MPSSIQITGVAGLSEGEVRLRSINRDQDTLVEPGVTIYFMDSGSNIRIRNGKIEIRDENSSTWYSLHIALDPGTEEPNSYFEEA